KASDRHRALARSGRREARTLREAHRHRDEGHVPPDQSASLRRGGLRTLLHGGLLTMSKPLIIGISARIHHPVGPVLDLGGVYTKTLHYLEQSVAHWVL